MNRTDRLDDQAVRVLLEGLENDLREIKTRQSIPRSSVATAFFIPGNTSGYDIDHYPVPANSTQRWAILFTGDGTQLRPYGYPILEVYDGSDRLSDYQIFNSNGVAYLYQIAHYLTHSLAFVLGVTTGSNATQVSANIDMIASTRGSFIVVDI